MDVSVALRRVENLVRDTLNYVLSKSIGLDWINDCGIAPDRLERWRARALEEKSNKGRCDPRLVYYADFFDLGPLIRKNWDKGLSEVFGDIKEIEVLLKILEGLRNPEAHRREFLPFEAQLAEGIAGRIRTKVTGYYSQLETGESYYPRFEFVQDSLGNSYSIGQGKSIVFSGALRPGDEVQFKLVASDPCGEDLEYFVYPNSRSFISSVRAEPPQWSADGEFRFEIQEEYVGTRFIFVAAVRSLRKFHALLEHVIGGIDDKVTFEYQVLPPRK